MKKKSQSLLFNSTKKPILFLLLVLSILPFELWAQDTDMDSYADAIDLDDDNDGILDVNECFVEGTASKVNNDSNPFLTTSIIDGQDFDIDITVTTPDGELLAGSAVNEIAFHEANGAGTYTSAFSQPVFDFQAMFTSIGRNFNNDDVFVGNFTLVLGDGTILNTADFMIANDVPVIASTAYGPHRENGDEFISGWNDNKLGVRSGPDQNGDGIADYFTDPTPHTSMDPGQSMARIIFTDSQVATKGVSSFSFELLGAGIGPYAGLDMYGKAGCDTDGDNIPNYLDLDSDDDGCPDALEGNGDFTDADIQNNILIGSVDVDGIPTIANSGQGVGSAANPNIQSDECDPCNSSSSSFTDADFDLIGDKCDLDDDNDGILDTNECPKPLLSEFQTIRPIDLDLSGTSTTNSVNATKDISAKFNLVSGSVIFSVVDGNTVETNGNTSWRAATNSPTRFEITGTAVVFARNTHGTGLRDNGDRDGFIDLDNVSYTVITTPEPGYVFKNIGLNYFCEVADETMTDGTQSMIWTSDNPTSRIEFYTTNSISFASQFIIQLAACPDTDGDGIADSEDFDSDNDGCPDAIEGTDDFTVRDIFNNFLPGGVDENGIPVVANPDQGVGTSADATMQSNECFPCNSNSVLFTDNDLDGVGDLCDLDDDNDGILDINECFVEGTASNVNNDSNPFLTTGIINGQDTDIDITVTTTDGELLAIASSNVIAFHEANGAGTYTSTFSQPVFDFQAMFTSIGRNFNNDDVFIGNFTLVLGDGTILNTADFVIAMDVPVIPSTAYGPHREIGDEFISGWNDDRIGVRSGPDQNGDGIADYFTDTTPWRSTDPGQAMARIIFTDAQIKMKGISSFSFELLGAGIGPYAGLDLYGQAYCDTDGDNITNNFDLDSDSDGCPDAIEGGDNFLYTDIHNSILTGGVNDEGIPLVAVPGQAIGTSTDSSIRSDECDPCNNNSSLFTDNDMDSVGDVCDLDDDNDGILDTYECPKPLDDSFLAVRPIDLDLSGTSTTNSVNATKDISAKFNLVPGSVIFSVVNGNIAEVAGNTSWRVATNSPTRFEISGTASVFAKNAHGAGLRDNGDKDGFIDLDNVSYTVTTTPEPGYNFNNIGSNYFCEVTNETLTDGTQLMVWLSDTPTSRIEFYTTNSAEFGSHITIRLAVCVDTDGDGITDNFDLDSDNDGCTDALEEEVSDLDSDGIAGVGTPTVDADGLVTSITYTSPPNDIWQNSLIGPCLPEICDDNIDNNGNNYIDEADFECSESFLEANSISVFNSTCCTVCPEGDTYIIAPYWIGDQHSLKNMDNLAYNKPVYSSSRVTLSTASFSVDDQFDNNKLAITKFEENPWVDIDLVGHFNINEIKISGQSNCCTTTQYDYLVLLSEVPFPADNLNNILSMVPTPSQYTHTQQGGNSFSITPTETARYVRVYLNGFGELRLSEVEVIGDVLPTSNPYDYDWGSPDIGNTPNPECLESGSYQVTVTDRDTGASAVTTVNI